MSYYVVEGLWLLACIGIGVVIGHFWDDLVDAVEAAMREFLP